ncbi:hypothetical protein HPP92_001391 [Vanilla planifolia]|uniref:Zinc finger PHD-type domain-containing protein n=1 Tax=Vanilla planifolia TaxID=51239 RepID=A0A835RZR1_VANPL|nr:hypothetical protein HPP92_001391 [Vanilla planifolia]
MAENLMDVPTARPLEDWGDGQWTVDCSCGVNFDDGEEMVSCDECGVWVHTRCSRFVRGEASFACHNCKGAAKRPLSVDVSRDAEETEVAKLLVELPTKTDRCPPAIPSCGTPYRPPFRLWAHVPKEGVCTCRASLVEIRLCSGDYRRRSSLPIYGSAQAMCRRSSISSTRNSLAGRKRRQIT